MMPVGKGVAVLLDAGVMPLYYTVGFVVGMIAASDKGRYPDVFATWLVAGVVLWPVVLPWMLYTVYKREAGDRNRR